MDLWEESDEAVQLRKAFDAVDKEFRESKFVMTPSLLRLLAAVETVLAILDEESRASGRS